MIDLVVHGASGRMGGRIVALARARSGEFRVAAEIGRDKESLDRLLAAPDSPLVVIDFSAAGGPAKLVPHLVEGRVPLVCGTTGLTPADRQSLERLANVAPVVWAPNMSLGISVMARLVREASRLLPTADRDIVETHHRHKKDAPSGTATRLAEAAGEGHPVTIHSRRIGEVVGEHAFTFAFGHEAIALTHRALSRDVFAEGALAAALFAAGAGAGMYDMEAVLEGLARGGGESK